MDLFAVVATGVACFCLGRLSAGRTVSGRRAKAAKYNDAILALKEGRTPLLKRVAKIISGFVEKGYLSQRNPKAAFGLGVSNVLDWEAEEANALLKPLGIRLYFRSTEASDILLGSGKSVEAGDVGQITLWVNPGINGIAIMERLFTEGEDPPHMPDARGPQAALLRAAEVPGNK